VKKIVKTDQYLMKIWTKCHSLLFLATLYNTLPKINMRIGRLQSSRCFKYCWWLGCCTGRSLTTWYGVSWSTIHFPKVDSSS